MTAIRISRCSAHTCHKTKGSLGGGSYFVRSLKTVLFQAYQDFKPDDRSLTNYGQLLGDALYATAQGTYQPVVGDCLHIQSLQTAATSTENPC